MNFVQACFACQRIMCVHHVRPLISIEDGVLMVIVTIRYHCVITISVMY